MTRRAILPAALLAAALSTAFRVPADAADAPKPAPAAAKADHPASATMALGGLGHAGLMGLPEYHPPAAYSVDLVVTSPQQSMTMKRFVDQGRMRTEFSGLEGAENMVMIEAGDEQGTQYMVMPKEKRAMKQSRASMEGLGADLPKPEPAKTEAAPANVKIEDLGDETRDGRAVKKLRFSLEEGTALGWFDKQTGAPVRMESSVEGKTSVLEWKNLQTGPQPEKLFTVPKEYEVTDMDEMMSQMKKMGGMQGPGSAMKGLMGNFGGGKPGMAVGGAGGGMMSGMAQSYGQSMGSNLGSTFGASLGASLGGPLGSIAGQYIGGKVGGMIGKKAADVVIPGK